MAGISDKALKQQYVENKYRFNDGSELANKEFSDGSGLEMYETDFRGYDPQIGRFIQQDPLSDLFEDWSPYAFAADNPIYLNDPMGLAPNDSTGHDSGVKPMEPVTVSAKKKDCKTCNAPSVAAAIPQINPATNPLRPVPNTPPGKVIPINKPEPTVTPLLPGLTPLAGGLTAIGVGIPLGGPSFPEGDEGYYLGGKHPLLGPLEYPLPAEDKNNNKPLYLIRFGNSPESIQQLAADAAKAFATGRFPHGVSTFIRTRISGSDKKHRSALLREVQKYFRVERTGLNPDHYTVVLPDPVTWQDAMIFNSLFKLP